MSAVRGIELALLLRVVRYLPVARNRSGIPYRPEGRCWTSLEGGNRGMCGGGSRSLRGYGEIFHLGASTPPSRGGPPLEAVTASLAMATHASACGWCRSSAAHPPAVRPPSGAARRR